MSAVAASLLLRKIYFIYKVTIPMFSKTGEDEPGYNFHSFIGVCCCARSTPRLQFSTYKVVTLIFFNAGEYGVDYFFTIFILCRCSFCCEPVVAAKPRFKLFRPSQQVGDLAQKGRFCVSSLTFNKKIFCFIDIGKLKKSEKK